MSAEQSQLPEISRPAIAAVKRWEWIGLLLVLAVALGARAFKLSSDKFWLDEIWSFEIAAGNCDVHFAVPDDQLVPGPSLSRSESRQPLIGIWPTLARNIHPPVYFVTLRLWMEAFGWDETTATWLSILFSMLAIVVFWDLLRMMHDPATAIAGASVMAVSGIQIMYAREVKAYSMFPLLLLIVTNLVVRLDKLGVTRKRCIGIAVCVMLAVLTHFLAALTLIGLLAYALFEYRGAVRRAAAGSLLAGAGLILICWGPLVRTQYGHVDLDIWMYDAASQWSRAFWNLAQLPSRFLGFDEPMPFSFSKPSPTLLGVVIFVIPLLLWKKQPAMRFWFLMAITTVVPIWLRDGMAHRCMSLNIRYMLGAWAPVIAIMLTMIQPSKLRRFVQWTLVVAACSSYPYCVWPWTIPDTDLRGAARFVDRQSGSAAKVVVLYAGIPMRVAPNSPNTMYMTVKHWQKTPSDIVLMSHPLEPGLSEKLRAYDRVFLHAWPGNPAELMPGWKVLRSFGTWTVSAGMVYEMAPQKMDHP